VKPVEAAEAISAPAAAVIIKADLSAPADCRRLVDEAASRARPPRRAHQHGVGLPRRAARRQDDAAWDAVVNVDLKAAFLCARAAVPHMRRTGEGGRIINFADWVAASGRPRYKGFSRTTSPSAASSA
jgi:NAD(P)-dependent dehydrogenase (short-subunit alcohol dehydrogenase family)